MLVDGSWVETPFTTTDGKYFRPEPTFRIETTESEFPIEENRYHLYSAPICPWAHQLIIMIKLKGLETFISTTEITLQTNQGWTFTEDSPDPLGFSYLHEVYSASSPSYTGRAIVPVLWDKHTNGIASNHSNDLLLFFNNAFTSLNTSIDYYPQILREQIDEINELIYEKINLGVYIAGFSTNEYYYSTSVREVFETLDELENRLSNQRFLCGNQITIADIRLFVTLIRFDSVYYALFKCNLKMIEDYTHLKEYLRDLFQSPPIYETVNLDLIKYSYYSISRTNPYKIIPVGPQIDYFSSHSRNLIKSEFR